METNGLKYSAIPDFVLPEMKIRIKSELVGNAEKINEGIAFLAVEEYLRTVPMEQMVSVNSGSLYALNYYICAQGSIASINILHAIEGLVKSALLSNASDVTIFHNHPTGIAHPSQSDLDFVYLAAHALELFSIKLNDFFVVGEVDGGLYSCKQHHPEYFETSADNFFKFEPAEIE